MLTKYHVIVSTISSLKNMAFFIKSKHRYRKNERRDFEKTKFISVL